MAPSSYSRHADACRPHLSTGFRVRFHVISQVQAALAYISGLNASVPNVTERVEMYKLQQTLKARNNDTASLSKGKAIEFVDVATKLDQICLR